MTAKILVETAGPVTTLIINRPLAKNALDNEAAHGLADALQAFDADAGCRVAAGRRMQRAERVAELAGRQRDRLAFRGTHRILDDPAVQRLADLDEEPAFGGGLDQRDLQALMGHLRARTA